MDEAGSDFRATKDLDISEAVARDMSAFLDTMDREDVDLKNFGIRGMRKESKNRFSADQLLRTSTSAREDYSTLN